MIKDWSGNSNSIYKTLGASNHTFEPREQHDYYATDPEAIDVLLGAESFLGPIWECAAGEGHLSERLKHHGHSVISTDLVERDYSLDAVKDFLTYEKPLAPNIITNPPYKFAQQFCEHAYRLLPKGGKVAMFLKLQFLEGKARKKMYQNMPPYKVLVSSSRILCAKNGDFESMRAGGGSAVAYAWFIWQKDYKGKSVIEWVN